jgi:hypothetical protein
MWATFESIDQSIHPSIDLQTFKFHQMHQILVAHKLKAILDTGLKNSCQIIANWTITQMNKYSEYSSNGGNSFIPHSQISELWAPTQSRTKFVIVPNSTLDSRPKQTHTKCKITLTNHHFNFCFLVGSAPQEETIKECRVHLVPHF